MAHRSSDEVKGLVKDLYESPQWTNLRNEDKRLAEILYGNHAGQLLTALQEQAQFKTVVPVASPSADHYAHDAESQLRESLYFHATAHNPRWQKRADTIEIGAAGIWNKLNPGGRAQRQIIRNMVVRNFAGVFLCWSGFKLPSATDKEANDAYRDSYFPFHLEIDGPQTCAFLEDQGQVSLAVRKVTKPLVELVQDYEKDSKEKDRTPLQIWAQDFPNLRAGFGINEEDESNFLKAKADIWYVDDGSYQCHYVELPNGKGYEQISNQKDDEPWPNPFGRPAFHFAAGWWNPDASNVADRYQALMRPVILARYDLDLVNSIMASLSASLPLRVVDDMPVELITALEQMDAADRPDFLEATVAKEYQNGIIGTIGKFNSHPMPVPELLGKQYEDKMAEWQQMLPRPVPEDVTIRNSTVSAVTLQVEAKRLRYGTPLEMIASVIHDTVQDCFQFFRVQEKSPAYNFPATGKDGYEGLSLVTTGAETVKGKAVKAGAKVRLDPEALGDNRDWYTLEVVPLDLSPAAKTARREEAEQRKASGSITKQDYFELLDVTNVTEYVEQLETEKLLEMSFIGDAQAANAAADRYVQMMTGMDMSVLGPGIGPPPQQGQNGSQGPNTYQVQSPRINEQPQAVTS